MTAVNVNNDDFRWDRLLDRLNHKNIIPVIGPGLYRVEIGAEGKDERFLYDYLADRMSETCGIYLKPGETPSFAKACFEFLKKNNNYYPKLSDFLKEILKGVRLIHPNALWKLARIKKINLFINTVYDNFLSGTLKTVRRFPTRELYYTVDEKETGKMDIELSKCLDNSECTVVYQVFGNIYKNVAPAFTEKDILETTVEFHRDLVSDRQTNRLYWRLKNSSLLFIGCGFDDWLFRFFIQTIADEPQRFSKHNMFFKFVADNFANNKVHFNGLFQYLKNYGVEVFHSLDVSDFVDLLFEKVETNYPEEIIQSSDFPGAVFISFEGSDRPMAQRLAANLENDGIGIWLDEREFEGGGLVDETIIKAINNCRAFIPLISQNSRQIQTDDKKLKYHIQEWYRAYSNKVSGEDLEIIPVKIDDTKWMYEKFKKLFHLKIPGGDKAGDYGKLINQLRDIQRKIQD